MRKHSAFHAVEHWEDLGVPDEVLDSSEEEVVHALEADVHVASSLHENSIRNHHLPA